MTALLALSVDDRRYALPLSAVERIVRIVEVTPLPSAPEIVAGVVNVHGRVIPVVDLRKRFTLREPVIALSDQLIVAHTSDRRGGHRSGQRAQTGCDHDGCAHAGDEWPGCNAQDHGDCAGKLDEISSARRCRANITAKGIDYGIASASRR